MVTTMVIGVGAAGVAREVLAGRLPRRGAGLIDWRAAGSMLMRLETLALAP